MIDFLGLGAQKSGTSWVYACLYEHPEICAPIKEIHFFSRDRFSKGQAWYEKHFERCAVDKVKGEFSTSYLYSNKAPERIHALYPRAKLIAIVRNPIDRAFSQYRNAIKAGEITENISFEVFAKTNESVIGQGMYAAQLERYRAHFPEEQILVQVYEDSRRNPEKFIRDVYQFLGVDTSFVPSMLHREVNVARTPKRTWIDRVMRDTAEFLRRNGLDRLVWYVKRSGATDLVRSFNTKDTSLSFDEKTKGELKAVFTEDAKRLGAMLNRDVVAEWDLE